MDEQISQFVSITGASSEKAKFYVESARGDVQEAVSTYFEAEGAQGESTNIAAAADDDNTALGAAASAGPRTLSGEPAPAIPDGWGSGDGGVGSGSSAKRKAAQSSGSGGGSGSSRFASLADYRSSVPAGRSGPGGRGNDDDDDDDDEDDDDDGRDPLNFFTGGERSGLSVQNPDHGRRRGKPPNVVQDILQRARDMASGQGGGHHQDEDWDDDAGLGGASTSRAFAGQGHSLTADSGEAGAGASAPQASSNALPGSFELAGQGSQENAPPDEIASRRIIFWQDGFSLEDGPLCRYDDPQHAQTLAMINQGAAPLSFLNVRFGQRVNLTVEQRQEKYTPPPPPPMKPFGGSGNRLGSPAPALATSAAPSTTTATTNAASTSSSSAPATNTSFEVDASQPTTQLQIRLADGQRVVGRFNHSHTVADVRNYINASHPNMADCAYVLQASFPPKPIVDEAQSLADAGLINAVVIQKWT